MNRPFLDTREKYTHMAVKYYKWPLNIPTFSIARPIVGLVNAALFWSGPVRHNPVPVLTPEERFHLNLEFGTLLISKAQLGKYFLDFISYNKLLKNVYCQSLFIQHLYILPSSWRDSNLPLRLLWPLCASPPLPIRVARCFIFIPKIPIWVNFGGPWIVKCWYNLWPFGIFYDPLGCIMNIW
jgi:hypothetical protein